MSEVKVLREFKCWNCGADETVVGIATEELIKKGKVKEGAIYASRIVPLPLLPPETAILTVPTMIKYWDICAKCGVEYIKRVVTLDAPVTMQAAP